MTSPATPAENPAQAPADTSGADDASPSESGASWFDATTGRGPEGDFATDTEPTAAAPDQPESGVQGSEPEPPQAEPNSQPQAQPTPEQTSPQPDDVVRLTRTQLEREIQSRADKLIAKQAREAAKAREIEEKARQEADLDRRLEEDPYGVAEEIRTQREQARSMQSQIEPIHNAIRDTSRSYDTLVVDRVVTALPPDVQQRLYQEIQPVGIEGRSRMVTAALDEIRKAAVAEGKAAGEKAAEQKLRKSSAFRKELLAELRGSEDEPELMPTSGRSPQPADMDDWIRMASNASRPY
jgi:hypothetical protein